MCMSEDGQVDLGSYSNSVMLFKVFHDAAMKYVYKEGWKCAFLSFNNRLSKE